MIAELLSHPVPDTYVQYLRLKLRRVAAEKATSAEVQKKTFSRRPLTLTGQVPLTGDAFSRTMAASLSSPQPTCRSHTSQRRMKNNNCLAILAGCTLCLHFRAALKDSWKFCHWDLLIEVLLSLPGRIGFPHMQIGTRIPFSLAIQIVLPGIDDENFTYCLNCTSLNSTEPQISQINSSLECSFTGTRPSFTLTSGLSELTKLFSGSKTIRGCR